MVDANHIAEIKMFEGFKGMKNFRQEKSNKNKHCNESRKENVSDYF